MSIQAEYLAGSPGFYVVNRGTKIATSRWPTREQAEADAARRNAIEPSTPGLLVVDHVEGDSRHDLDFWCESQVDAAARAMFQVDPTYGTDWDGAAAYTKAFFRDMARKGLRAAHAAAPGSEAPSSVPSKGLGDKG